MLQNLIIDPWVDGSHKYAVPLGDEVRLVYDGDHAWLTYHIIDNEIVSVLTCSTNRPKRRRPPAL